MSKYEQSSFYTLGGFARRFLSACFLCLACLGLISLGLVPSNASAENRQSNVVSQPGNNNQFHLNSQPDPINILLISGYNQLLPWSQQVYQGIWKEISQSNTKVNLFFENANGELNLDEARKRLYVESIALRHQSRDIDIIISDNYHGYQFMDLMGQLGFFPNAKRVYFDELNRNQELISLKPERDVIVNNLALNRQVKVLLETFPDVRTIHMFDTEFTNRSPHYEHIKKQIEEQRLNIKVKLWDSTSISEVQRRANSLGESDVFVYLPVFTNGDNLLVNPKEYLKLISPYFDRPIYSFWTTFVGEGIIGGLVLSPEMLGRGIIQASLNVLEGANATNEYQISEWHYDETLLNRYGIRIHYDADSVVFKNPTRNILDDYPLEIGAVSLCFLMLLAGTLLYKNNKLKHAYIESEVNKTASENALLKVKNLSKTKSEFLAIMSHEIRTPINGVIGVFELLRTRISDKETLKLIDTGEACNTHLLQTVNDILDFSKLESRKLSLSKRQAKLKKMMTQVYEYAKICNANGDVKVTLEMSQLEDVWVDVDDIRIKQVITNLVNNALKFTPRGEVSITAETKRLAEVYFFCTIQDTGLGISRAKQTKLFTPFVQQENYLQKSVTGTGLGLSICKELIQLMDGKIRLSSEEGVGTSVTIEIPVTVIQPNIDEVNIHEPLIIEKSLKLLLVEDNSINQEIISTLLVERGHRVDICSNGQESIEHLQSYNGRYDAILMDIQMPVMNGYDASAKIRSGGAGSRHNLTPIVAVTAHVSLDEEQKAFKAGMTTITHKPVKIDRLVNDVFKAIKMCRPTESAAKMMH